MNYNQIMFQLKQSMELKMLPKQKKNGEQTGVRKFSFLPEAPSLTKKLAIKSKSDISNRIFSINCSFFGCGGEKVF